MAFGRLAPQRPAGDREKQHYGEQQLGDRGCPIVLDRHVRQVEIDNEDQDIERPVDLDEHHGHGRQAADDDERDQRVFH